MKILIGCECSGIVRDAFRAVGQHDAWSCDLKQCEGDPRWHIQGDVIEAIKSRRWHFIGLHPDCTAMALSGNRWYGQGMPRHQERIEAIAWTVALWELAKQRARHVYLENPTGMLWGHLGARSVQYVQPHKFGHGETKKTGFALHNLPPLFHTSLVTGREQRVWKMPPGPNRKADRSRTFIGIAAAMADQWGSLDPCPPPEKS